MEGRSLYLPAHKGLMDLGGISYQGAYMSMDLSAHLQELDNLIAREKAKGGALIPVLHQAQELYGYLPKELQDYIADVKTGQCGASRGHHRIDTYSFDCNGFYGKVNHGP